MQSTQKYIMGVTVVTIIAVLGYLIFQNFTASQSDEIKNSEIKTSVSQSGTDNTTIETDTGKRLEIVANSGTNWGMSPFGSGKPLEEAEKKPEFKKPNLEWKTRTLSGITYVLGEGNPKEVAVSDIKAFYNCTTPYESRAMDQSGVIDGCPETQYLTKDIEQALLKVLQNPLWEKVVRECRDSFQYVGGIDQFDAAFVTGNVLDISTIMYIDPDGRKNLTGLYNLASLLKPEDVDTIPDIYRNSDCFKNRSLLYQMVNNVLGSYNAGAMTQAEGLGTIHAMLNDRLSRQYWLVP